MKIKISKVDGDISLKIIIDGKELQFDYVTLVNNLYLKNKIEDVDFSDEIDDWEKNEIKKLISEINGIVDNLEIEK